MSVYRWLFDTRTATGVCLGRPLDTVGRAYEGPVVFVDGHRWRLPARLLALLIERFGAHAPPGVVRVLPEHELFDTDDWLAPGVEFQDVNGDTGGPPLSTWLSELDTSEGRAEILSEGLRIA